MRALGHGYTNDTRGDGRTVVKRYQGPDAAGRHRRERSVLERLHGRLPVPPLLGGDDDSMRMGFVAGVHGQDLIDAGHGTLVLRSCGQMLRRIHRIDPAHVLPDTVHHSEHVLLHGDYGPNNILFDPDTFAVTAVLDWEWTHVGDPIGDLAWCEWIVRMHHREHAEAIGDFFKGYGIRPPWTQRHQAMLARCRSLLELCRRWTPEAANLWRQRLEITAAWTESP